MYLVGLHIYYKMIHGPYNIMLITISVLSNLWNQHFQCLSLPRAMVNGACHVHTVAMFISIRKWVWKYIGGQIMQLVRVLGQYIHVHACVRARACVCTFRLQWLPEVNTRSYSLNKGRNLATSWFCSFGYFMNDESLAQQNDYWPVFGWFNHAVAV